MSGKRWTRRGIGRSNHRLKLELLEPRVVLSANPVISEIMAVNDTTLADEDGDFSDWIEIHNPSEEPIDLDGWSLTDNSDNLNKWEFPAETVPAGGYLVVFASSKDRGIAGSELHTNFKLTSEGEYLALVEPDGITVAHAFAPQFPRQIEDLSYGLGQQVTVPLEIGALARILVPTSDNSALDWTSPGFDDSAWTDDPTGVGFEIGQAQGAAIAFANLTGAVGSQQFGGSLGMDFVVHSTITVNKLGVFDSDANGLARPLTSQLWARSGNSGTLITSLSFTPDDPGVLVDSDRFKRLDAPLSLEPGEYTIVAFGYGSGEPNGNTAGPADILKNTDDGGGAISFVGGGRFGAAGSFPAVTDSGPVNRYSAGTFEFSAPVFASDIATDLETPMHDINASVYVRLDFPIDDPTTVESLSLNMKYDDGFIAYLNGVEVARRNAPDTPAWNSSAVTARPLEEAKQFEDINISSELGLLQPGNNVLAIHGLNVDASDNDFLLVPRLVVVGAAGGDSLYFDNPTPGGPNNSESTFSGFVDDVTFSHEHGFYDGPISVILATPTENAEIRYTLDGSAPSSRNGTVYAGPVRVSGTTTLRAVALKGDLRPADVGTQSYFYLDNILDQPSRPAGFPASWNGVSPDYGIEQNPSDLALIAGDSEIPAEEYRQIFKDSFLSLPTMSIVMDVDDLFGSNGIYANPTQRGVNWERPASIEYILPDGTEGFQINAGLRVMGFTSRNPSATAKHSLRILFKKEYGAGRLNYPFFEDTTVDTFNTIALRANLRDTWLDRSWGGRNSSFIRDQWAKESQARMGQLETSGNFVHLYLNGLYWGLYNPTERPDAAFVADREGTSDEEYDAIKFCCGQRAVDGDLQKWNELLTLSQQGLASDAAYQFIQGNNPDGSRNPEFDVLIDIDNFIDYVINGQYHAANDWPGNYYAVRRRGPESQGFQFFTWDNDLAFAREEVNRDKTRSDNNNWWTESPGVMDIALRENPAYRLRFADHVQRHLFNDGGYTPEAAAQLWTELSDIVRPAVAAESLRWGDNRGTLRTPTDWEGAINRMLTNYFPQRTDIVLDQLRTRGLYPDVDAPILRINNQTQFGGQIDVGDRLSISGEGRIFFTINGADPLLRGTMTYSEPIELTETTRIMARAHDGQNWSALIETTFFLGTPATGDDLVISELNYNPHDAEPTLGESDLSAGQFEFLELQNISERTIDISGVQLVDGITFDFSAGDVSTLGAGQYVLVVRNQTAFATRYETAGLLIAGEYSGGLSNSGETITVIDSGGEILQQLTYNDSGAWPGRADGNGSSLELIRTEADGNDPSNWRSSNQFGGSPGSVAIEAVTDVVVNEVLTNPLAPMVDAIELFNTTGEDIDIGGWYLSDSSANYRKFRLPLDTTIPTGGYLVLDEHDFNRSGGIEPTDFALSGARGDDVWLVQSDLASGRLVRFVDRVEFGATLHGESLGLWPNGSGDLTPMMNVTLGEQNSEPRVGPLVISEIMYNPPVPAAVDITATDLEFIEIYNPTTVSVDLTGWRLAKGVDFAFPAGELLGAGEVIVITSFNPDDSSNVNRLTALRDTYSIDASVRLIGGWIGRLENAGERVQLLRPDESPVDQPDFVPLVLEDEVNYAVMAPWPSSPDGNGTSLTRSGVPLWGSSPTSWSAQEPSPGSVIFFAPVDADVNLDGTLNRADFRALVSGFGKRLGVTWVRGDVNGDGATGLADLILLQQNLTPEVVPSPASSPMVNITIDSVTVETVQIDEPLSKPDPAQRLHKAVDVALLDSTLLDPQLLNPSSDSLGKQSLHRSRRARLLHERTDLSEFLFFDRK